MGADASPPAKRRRLSGENWTEPRLRSRSSSSSDARVELAVRLLSQMRSIQANKNSIASQLRATEACENIQDAGHDLIFDDADSGITFKALLGPALEPSGTGTLDMQPELEEQTQEASPSSLPPIQIKVEVTASPCSSYMEQQPSTSTVVLQPTPSAPSVTALSTPRSSVVGAESSVERVAKQEAQVLARIAELRRQGLWTASRLPMIEMPPRNKTQWDYLQEEMHWMATDFRQERTFKRQAAKKVFLNKILVSNRVGSLAGTALWKVASFLR
ncbi:unnamed protein product [Gongylonema pulchrum]|uniref:HSA domain-containing protein n=1 Tax=Gongylonema pulchrum TaxID=637853 RepID=A0A183EJB5_9BILA|nr:unnamed protein product [Gongylonema pulchrum]